MLERQRSVRSTYYFRHSHLRRHSTLIRRIEALGHEVGYHHEALSRARGNIGRAAVLFREDLEALRASGVRISTVAAHGAPLSTINNRPFWKYYMLSDYGLEADAYDTVDKPGWTYVTDTGRSWGKRSTNMRDRAPSASSLGPLDGTHQVIRALVSIEGSACFTVHPERWAPLGCRYLRSWAFDQAATAVKRAVSVWRSGGAEP